jgi:hypothetical protein
VSTNAPAPTKVQSLYKAIPGNQTPIADVLKRMVREGRTITRGQKMRWQESREFYRGNQWITTNQGARTIQQLARNNTGPVQVMDFNAYNRLRQFTDGRVALLTKERPPYEVLPEDNDQDSIDAARQAEKFLAAKWGRSGWNIKSRLAELAKNGDIDGIAWLYVDWDAYDGNSANQMQAVRADGTPIESRNEYEALKAQDPDQQSLWKMARVEAPVGDVCWRVVLPGAISVDPFAIKNFGEAKWICESRVRPRVEVERRMGSSFKEAVREYNTMSEGRGNDVDYEDIHVEDGGKVNESSGVVVHHLYVKPCEEWPRGAHIEFCDKAPQKPLLTEEWKGELPYFCYVPRPDPGHFLKSRSIVDDLKPIQRDFNQTLRWVRQWMRKVAMSPIVLPIGGLRSDSIYNEDGYIEVHSVGQEPHHLNTPSEPAAILTNNLVWMTNEMEKISGVSSYAQGFTAPGGPESNVAIAGQVQQTEQNLSEVEANFVEAIEWGCSRSLKLVKENYTIPRGVVSDGVDDAQQFRAFTGALLRGSDRMRVNGPVMPRSKAQRMNSIAQFATLLGDKVLPYMAGLIDGDPTELQNDVQRDALNEREAVRELCGLVTNETAQKVYANFEEDKKRFSEAFNMVIQKGLDPQQVLSQEGIQPPQLTPMMVAAGIDMPLVEDFLNYPMALKELDNFRKGDGYRKLEEMAKQLLRERAAELKKGMQSQVMAMAQQQPQGQQQGSAPSPKGTPSPPKNSPPPGGTA